MHVQANCMMLHVCVVEYFCIACMGESECINHVYGGRRVSNSGRIERLVRVRVMGSGSKKRGRSLFCNVAHARAHTHTHTV